MTSAIYNGQNQHNLPAVARSRSLNRYDSSDSLLTMYMKEVNTFPTLSKEDEMEMAVRYAETGDANIANELMKSNLRFVVKIAMSYRNYGLSMMDIIAEGNLGLMHAIKKFHPSTGYRLTTYAMWWIKAYIHEFILKSWSIVKIGTTKLQRKIFFSLSKIKKHIGIIDGSLSSSKNKVESYFGDQAKEVIEIEQRIYNSDTSLNKPVSQDGDSLEMINVISGFEPTPEDVFLISHESKRKKDILYKAMSILSERELEIFNRRIISDDKARLEDLSIELKISKERVRQIEESIMDKLKKYALSESQA